MASKASSIQLFSISSPQMRAFHLTWMAFFVCFFAWFACAPLMPVIKGEFGLTKDQIANINIAAVAITILVRLLVGPLCDRFGPRKTYTGLGGRFFVFYRESIWPAKRTASNSFPSARRRCAPFT